MDEIFGYQFKDQSLLQRALTHRSASKKHNERLEYLGDAALNFSAADLLYRRFPEADEGDLSRYRARLVSGVTLAGIAIDLDLGQRIALGPGELKSGGHRRRSILADALEAVIGAIHLDGGIEAAQTVVNELLRERVENLPPANELKDPKTRLQEFLQGRQFGLPQYDLLKVTGADHEKQFFVRCAIPDQQLQTEGDGGSRRKAEQEAAQKMLDLKDQLSKARKKA